MNTNPMRLGGDRRERHDPVCDEHHDDAADEHDHRRDEGRDRLVESLADHIHVVGDAREHVADGVGIEVFEGQKVDLFGDFGAQRPGIFLRDRRHDQPLHIRTDKTQSVDYDEEHAQAEHFLHIHAEDLVDAVIGQVQERRLNGVRQVAENVRADEVEYRTRDREHERYNDGDNKGLDEQDELAHRLLKSFGFSATRGPGPCGLRRTGGRFFSSLMPLTSHRIFQFFRGKL